MNYNDIPLEELIAEQQRRKAAKTQPPVNAGGGQDISALLSTLVGEKSSAFTPAMNYHKRLIGEKPDAVGAQGNDLVNDLVKTALGEKVKQAFKDPLDTQLKEERIKAIQAGLMVDEAGNVIGKAPRPLNEKEQFDMEQDQIANKNQAEFIRSNAQDMLNTIGEIKGEGNQNMKYFGMAGNLPTLAAPSTYLEGEYDQRKNWETNVNKLLSGKIVELITDMKQASKTGATGFGQLNMSELKTLENASTALKRDLAPQDALRYLNEIETIQKRVLGGGQSAAVTPTPTGQIDDDTAYQEYLKAIGG